jgi:protein-disulfide isomerase
VVYLENRRSFGGVSEEEAREQIRERLRKEQARELYLAKLKELRAQASVVINLERPRIHIPQSIAFNAKGPAGAPVTLVEFADFECPYCRSAQPVVRQLLTKYPSAVRLVFIHMPIEAHDHAIEAARASECAARQGAFWAYHDKLWETALPLSFPALKEIADATLPDSQRFVSCLTGKETASLPAQDLELGRKLGVPSRRRSL